MKKKNPTLKLFASSFIIILISTAIVVFIILPTVNYIKNLKNDIQKIEQESSDQYQKIKLLKKSIAELPTVREKAKLFEQSMIDKNDAVKLIQELEDLAISKGVTQSLNIKDGKDDSFILDFRINGSFFETLQYLHALEHLPFYVIIDSVNWNKINSEEVSISFSATIFTK